MAIGTSFICAITLLIIGCQMVLAKEYGVLAAESYHEKENFCIIYFPEFSSPPGQKSEANFRILQDESSQDFCDMMPKSDNDFKGKFVLLARNNCSLTTQARVVQELGGEGALFITPGGKVNHVEVNASAAEEINITVALISENSVQKLKAMGGNSTYSAPVTVCIFAPHGYNSDFSLLIIWVIAMITVSVGSYWSGLVRYSIYSGEMNKLPAAEIKPSHCRHIQQPVAEESSLNISSYSVGIFVLCMGLMLILLYFFFDYLVYFIIGLFALASAVAVYNCLEPLFLRLPLDCCKFPELSFMNITCNVDLRQITMVAISMSLSITWVILRNQKYSWILQDVLGVAFCIYMLKSVRLPNMKICAILHILLFFYDIFFVFITPFFTMKGQSVMEEVATGGTSEEMLPMVLKVAHFGFDPVTICYMQFSLLGFGDILVPGLLVSYCHAFDLITGHSKIYFPLTAGMYGIGLLFTFAGLYIMNSAQPALLYLVPATLLPPLAVAWCRGQLSLLWRGFKSQREVDVNPNIIAPDVVGSNVVSEKPPSPVISPAIPDSTANSCTKIDHSSTEVVGDNMGEKKRLLR